MYKKLWTTTCILALTLGTTACKKDAPAGTSNPPDSSADGGSSDGDGGSSDGGDEGGGSEDGGDGGDGGTPSADDPTQTVCDAQVSDTPSVYFEETLMIRLPMGLSDQNLVERQPGFAQAAPAESVSCVEGLPGATINVAILGAYQEDAAKDMNTYIDETVKALIGETPFTLEDTKVNGRNAETIVNVSGDNPGKAWMVMKSGGGFVFYAYYEVHPNAWNAIKKTFKASTDKMLVLAK